MIKKIAFMTGGGDCAGINSFIAAAVRHGINKYDLEFVGIRKAFEGATADDVENYLMPLDLAAVDELEIKASTILESSRFNPFSKENTEKGYPQKLLSNLKKIGVNAVLATGGNDTIKSCMGLSNLGFPVLAAPKSIDNDVSGTDTMLGYKSAISFGAEAVRSTAESAKTHHRISIVEIMGRDAGWLALEIGVAAHADIILIPEKYIDLATLCQRISKIYETQGYVNIVVAEGFRLHSDDVVLQKAKAESPVVKAMTEETLGVDTHGNPKLGGIGQILRRIIKVQLGLKKIEDVRATDLGFTLRGLTPKTDDIVLGTRFGNSAVDLLLSGTTNVMVGIQGTKIVTVPFLDALVQKQVNWSDVELKNVGVMFE